MKNLLKPVDEPEALVLKALLNQNGIDAYIVSFHDTAYNGLFQTQYGWGVIRVAETDYPKALKIVQEWKGSAPDELPWQGTSPRWE